MASFDDYLKNSGLAQWEINRLTPEELQAASRGFANTNDFTKPSLSMNNTALEGIDVNATGTGPTWEQGYASPSPTTIGDYAASDMTNAVDPRAGLEIAGVDYGTTIGELAPTQQPGMLDKGLAGLGDATDWYGKNIGIGGTVAGLQTAGNLWGTWQAKKAMDKELGMKAEELALAKDKYQDEKGRRAGLAAAYA